MGKYSKLQSEMILMAVFYIDAVVKCGIPPEEAKEMVLDSMKKLTGKDKKEGNKP
ncbi:MAG TPA: hypothetical protein VLZ83_16525 [Edaphocola sp.]|nr:hypothetical protein [Edaphocola sp.]